MVESKRNFPCAWQLHLSMAVAIAYPLPYTHTCPCSRLHLCLPKALLFLSFINSASALHRMVGAWN